MLHHEAASHDHLDGRYAIEDEIGSGGMSVVYRGRDLKHDRSVAIKVLRPELSAHVGADRFHREVEFAATLNHPHILPLFDSGEYKGSLYYVMPCIEEGSLRERIDREGPLPVDEAIGIARDIASALEAAHAQGIVHRDIKPANILFSGGEAVVSDFGIARAIAAEDGERLTLSGLSIGSPAFMSPEQAAAEPVDERSDLYSLGCVLYTMLTGSPPFERSTVKAMMAAHMAEPPPSVREFRPEVSNGLDQIIQTALQKEPEDRFKSATEFIAALERPEVIPDRARTRRRRKAVRATLIAASATAAVAAIGWLAWLAFAPAPLPVTDSNRVMVFPLIEAGNIADGRGYDAALAIGNALNYAHPLTFVNGWNWLDVDERMDVGRLTDDMARDIALEQRSRWYVTGTILGVGDSATVTLLLHDAVADTGAARELAAGEANLAGITDAGLDATTRLLPALLEPGREIDAGVLQASRSSNPAAMLEWFQGERAYRNSRFREALDHYRLALEADSGWAFAALKAAQAASWVKDTSALTLIGRALAGTELMPAKYQAFTRGLHGYLSADPDEAVTGFESALAIDSSWAEPWTALGETHYHLQPDWENNDAMARRYFERSLAADSAFFVPLYHLSQIALRDGEVEEAEQLTDAYRRADPEASLGSVVLAMDCVRSGPDSIDWQGVMSADESDAAEVGLGLIEGLKEMSCSAAALRAILSDGEADPGWRRAASRGLAFMWLAQGRWEAAAALFDSTVADGEPGNMAYYPYLAIAGYAPFESRAAQSMSYLPTDPEGQSVAALWFLGWWAYHMGDIEALRSIVEHALVAADLSERPEDPAIAAGLAARLAATDGDTARAIELLEAHPPRSAEDGDLEWKPDSPLPLSRLLLAELLLATRQYERAIEVADGFDGRPKIYLPLIPRSLEIRREAAEGLGGRGLASEYGRRLEALR